MFSKTLQCVIPTKNTLWCNKLNYTECPANNWSNVNLGSESLGAFFWFYIILIVKLSISNRALTDHALTCKHIFGVLIIFSVNFLLDIWTYTFNFLPRKCVEKRMHNGSNKMCTNWFDFRGHETVFFSTGKSRKTIEDDWMTLSGFIFIFPTRKQHSGLCTYSVSIISVQA